MKNNLKVLSIISLVAAIPSLIIIDWYYKGYGVFFMFLFLTIGLVLDQIVRLKFPMLIVTPISSYRKNKRMNILALILFMQSPMGLIYGNRIYHNLGFWLLVIMICTGVSFNQIARIKYYYLVESEDKNI